MNMMYRLANYARTTNKNIEGSVFDKKEEEIKDDNSLDIEETLDSNKILQRHENGRLDISNTLRSIWMRFSNIFESSELSFLPFKKSNIPIIVFFYFFKLTRFSQKT